MLVVSKRYNLALASLWGLAIALALGSKAYDPDPEEALPPVTVDFTVNNSGAIDFSDGTTDDTVSSLALSGTFEKAADDRITLRNVPVTLDVNTSWSANVLPASSDELLRGDFSGEVSEDLEFGFDRQPTAGQIRVEFEGTTTLVTFPASGNVSVQTGSNTARAFSFGDFRNAHTDDNRDLDQRMASKAYRVLENLWLVTRMSETVHREIESQLGMLESVGVQTSLELTCNDASADPPASYVLQWSNDISATGSAGNGDNFTAVWRNCLINADSRHLEGTAEINNYQLANAVFPRTMSYTVQLSSLFFANDDIPLGAFPSSNRERVEGTLTVTATEL